MDLDRDSSKPSLPREFNPAVGSPRSTPRGPRSPFATTPQHLCLHHHRYISSMSSEGFDRSLFYPPSTSPHVTPLEPTSEQEKGIQVLSEYFGRDGFEAPTEGGRGWDRLSMREMMFLVG